MNTSSILNLKQLSWEEYCQEIYQLSSLEVEQKIRDSEFDSPEENDKNIEEYRKALYIVLATVKEPDYNEEMLQYYDEHIGDVKLPEGFEHIENDQIWDDGIPYFHYIAIKGFGFEPYTLD